MTSGPPGVQFDDPTSLSTTAHFASPGTYTIQLLADDGFGSAVNSFTVIVENQTPYQLWTDGSFLNSFPDNSESENQDDDIFSNWQEFAFGMDPTSGMMDAVNYTPGGAVANGGYPTARDFATGGNPPDLHVVFARRKNHLAAGLVYEVQFSADLLRWTASGNTPNLETGPGAPGELEAVSVPFPATVPLEGGGTSEPSYFRLSVGSN